MNCGLNYTKNFNVSKLEPKILEAKKVRRFCEYLKQYFKNENDYFYSIYTNNKWSYGMLDYNFMKYLVKEIILSGEYNVEGIALYTYTSPDIIYDIVAGVNQNPSFITCCRLIELHQMIKPKLYEEALENSA